MVTTATSEEILYNPKDVAFFLEKYPQFRKKIRNLSIYTIIGGIEGLLSIFLPAMLYYIVHPYNFSQIWISTLGTIDGSIGLIFNVGLIISAVGLFYLGFRILKLSWGYSRLVNNIVRISIPVAINTSLGIILLCIYTMEDKISIHSVGAYMFFAGAGVIFGLYTWLLKLTGLIDKTYSMIKFTGVYCLVYIAFVPTSAINSYISGIEFTEMLGSTDPGLGLTRVLEWILIILFFMWLLIAGIIFLKISQDSKYHPQ